MKIGGHSTYEMMILPRGEQKALDDEVLVSRVQNGDDRAFRELFLRYHSYIAGVAYRLLGNDADLDDIVQETFMAVSDGIHRVKDGNHIKLYLVTIAVRRAKRRLKKRIIREDLRKRLKGEGCLNDQFENDEQLLEAYEMVGGLSNGLRIPWTLHEVEGYTIPETSMICGSSPATVKRRIKKANELIQKRLLHE